jgi:putative ABC transport system ATP-binding protein
MIHLEDLRVTFNVGTVIETRALQGLDLEILAGQFVSLIGSNGAGKTTLLNCTTVEVLPTRGRILIDGADVTLWPATWRSVRVARVIQDSLVGTCEALTIEENLAFVAARGTA